MKMKTNDKMKYDNDDEIEGGKMEKKEINMMG